MHSMAGFMGCQRRFAHASTLKHHCTTAHSLQRTPQQLVESHQHKHPSVNFPPETLQKLQTWKSFSYGKLHEELRTLCENGQLDMALHVLSYIDRPDTSPPDYVYLFLLKACIKKKALPHARQVVAHVASHRLEFTGLLGDYLVITLAKCGGMDDARKVFHALRCRTIFAWTAMISCYTDCGKGQEALRMYQIMQKDGMEPDRYTYVSLFKACGSISDLEQGRKLHDEVRRKGLTSNVFVGNTILSMYSKCGSIIEAEVTFNELWQRNVVSWNAMLSGYVEQSEASKALLLYRQMQEEGMEPNELTFVMAIQACCSKEVVLEENSNEEFSLVIGQALHADAHKKGFISHLLVASTLMCMYGKYGVVAKAEGVFSTLSKCNVVSWTTMLKGYVEQGQGGKALQMYRQMHEEGVSPDQQAYVLFLQACCSLAEEEEAVVVEGRSLKVRSLEIGQALHEDARRRGFVLDAFVGGTIVNMYGKCGSIVDAENVFIGLSQQDVVSWNVMLSAYVEQGQGEKALRLYKKMLEAGTLLDERTVVNTLQACVVYVENKEESLSAKSMCLEIGQTLHADVCRNGFTSNAFIGNTLINLYGKCGCILEAEHVFTWLSKCSIATWNVMLCAYLEQGRGDKALQLYRQMQEENVSPDERTFVITLQACGILIDNEEAVLSMHLSRQMMSLDIVHALHADAWRKGFASHVFVGNSLITLYAKCAAIEKAENVFVTLSGRNVVSWNAMLSAYFEQGQGERVLQLYTQMHEKGASPDPQTFVIALQACCALKEKEEDATIEGLPIKLMSLHIGQALHADARTKGLASHVFVGNTIVSMYGKCGRLVEAEDVFGGLCQHNVVSWNAVLSVCIEQGKGDQALQLYREMQDEGVILNDVTLVCILQACSETGSREVCSQLHFTAVCAGLDVSTFLATTMVHAYGGCASMADSQAVFYEMHQPAVESWNAILASFAGEGNYVASVQSVEEMCCRGSQPNRVTFFALLFACSHTGLVEKGLEYFLSMNRHFGLSPEIKHFVIMVDLLGRAGDFIKVEKMLSRMPVQPDLAFWLCLLGACRIHGNVQLGKQAYSHALQLQPDEAAVYVSMSNIYVNADVIEKA